MGLRNSNGAILNQSDKHSLSDPPQTGGEVPDERAGALVIDPAASLGTIEFFGGCSTICSPGPIALESGTLEIGGESGSETDSSAGPGISRSEMSTPALYWSPPEPTTCWAAPPREWLDSHGAVFDESTDAPIAAEDQAEKPLAELPERKPRIAA